MITPTDAISKIIGKSVSEFVKVNRYCVSEKNQMYCFTTPIFRTDNGNAVGDRFVCGDGCYEFYGSNSVVKVFENSIQFCRQSKLDEIFFPSTQNFSVLNSGKALRSKNFIIYPTLNGVLVKAFIKTNRFPLTLQSYGSTEVKSNSKYFAFMSGKFEPQFTVNAMYAEDDYESVFFNAELSVEKRTDSVYELEAYSCKDATKVLYEMNLYESKLIQDTTVESRRPEENNVYGSISFVGKSPECGTQYLYSRIDVSMLGKIKDSEFDSVGLYVPYYMTTGAPLRLHTPFKRFCSFGSNWSNKIQSTDIHINGSIQKGFFEFDLSSHLLDKRGRLKTSDGIVIRPYTVDERFSIIATADNYFTPQILRLNLKKENEK